MATREPDPTSENVWSCDEWSTIPLQGHNQQGIWSLNLNIKLLDVQQMVWTKL